MLPVERVLNGLRMDVATEKPLVVHLDQNILTIKT